MAVLKCTICGGELDVNEDLSIGVCKFCDSTIVIPKNLDRKGNLYNRAVFLRQNSEFDKAASAYEDILKEDNSDAEAHWGLVLSKYGIEYVSDPRTGQRVPTCHRTQAVSILSDPDYQEALECADIEARRVIEEEAKRINQIQAKILEISKNEPPYDIFICYKESDEFGNRTEDSAVAQELYYELTKKNYRVFFARKTLESKLGTEYEPIIYAALNSAKVMIVLGTKAENFNSVWVRNEWTRFLKMSESTHKTIIPAYRGISPYELPIELSGLQAQDMSKIGFMQDLLDGIEKCVHRGASRRETSNASYAVASLERLVQNSDTYLKLNDISAAEDVYSTMIKEYPGDYRGWWGLILCKTKNFSEDILDQTELNKWFGYVKQLADPKDFQGLEKKYVNYAKKVSLLAADEDIKVINSIIRKYNDGITSHMGEIETLRTKIEEREEQWKWQNNTALDKIKKAENTISASESKRTSKKAGLSIGGTLFFVGVLVLFSGGWGILWGLIIGFIGFITFIMNNENQDCPSFKTLDYNEERARESIQSAKKEQIEYKLQRDQDVVAIEKSISDMENDIADLQGKCENCERYLALGKEKISELWFAKRCESFGVDQPYDVNIQKCRNAALDIAENNIDNVDDTVSFACPACGEMISESRTVLISNGFVICNHCGNTIEVSSSS